MVYVKSIDGNPLMPTENAKARRLLKEKKAIVKGRDPFTIQLTYKTEAENVQDVTLGIDSGYMNVGYSAVTAQKELICGEIKLMTEMSKRINERAMYRKNRRQHLRYRKARWSNRKVEIGWLAPSIQHKLDSHIRFIDKIKGIIPVNKIIVEVANFDIPKIKNPNISGVEYRQGEQLGFWNIREYVLYRDGHKCQNPDCKNKEKSPILRVHHIIQKENGGTDKPDNLITLCNKCHTSENHKNGKLSNIRKPGKEFKSETFMTTVRWKLVNNLGCAHTYGYQTKHKRINSGIEKSHCNDAFVIAGGNTQKRAEPIMYEQARRNNRSFDKFFDAQYIDIRTGKETKGSELSCGRTTRNKDKNGENLKQFRGKKVRNGYIQHRKEKRYFYQCKDLVLLEGEIYRVRTSRKKEKISKKTGVVTSYIEVELEKNGKTRRVKTECLKPYRFRKGFVNF